MRPITSHRTLSTVWLPPLVLVGLGLLAYHNSFHGPFIFDDSTWIVDNDSIRSLWPPGPVLTATPRPVVNLTLAVNYALGGTSVVGYHVVNLAIHVASALVLYGVVRRTLLRPGTSTRSPGEATSFAAAAGAIWLVHPLQTQSVTYVVQRSESLMGLFYLASLYCVIRGAEGRRRVFWQAGAIASCWIGMMAKEVMATAPLVILLYDRIFLTASWTRLVRERWSLHLALASSWCWLASSVAPTLTAETGTAGFRAPVLSPVEYLLSQSGVLLHYLKLVFWPHPLCLDYYWPIARSELAIVLPGLLVIGLLVTSLWALRRRPALGFLGFSTFLILAPTSSIVPIADLAVEHRMYLPLAGLTILFLLGGQMLLKTIAEHCRLAPRARARLAISTLAALVTCLTVLTVVRNRDYRSVESIWESVLAVNPDNPRAFNELGRVLSRKGRRADAYLCYRRAVALSDRSDMRPLAPFHYNLASSLHDQKIHAEAIHHYRRALHLQPRSTRVLVNLGTALNEVGDLEGAIECYRRALEIRPRYALAHNNLALALEKKGQDEEALRSFERALDGEPKIAAIRLNMARTLTRLGRSRQAIRLYMEFARQCSAGRDASRAVAALESALTLAEELGDEGLVSRLKELARSIGEGHAHGRE